MFNKGRRPVVVGHRGAPRVAPENTPASFAAAASAGATWVELDVRRCADGLVVHHDPRTSEGVPVVERTTEHLRVAGVWSLQGVLNHLPPGLGVDVEIKNLPGEPDYDEGDGLVSDLVPLLRAAAAERPLFASSFNPATLQTLKDAAPDIPIGLLHASTLKALPALQFAEELGASVLCTPVDAPGLDVDLIQAAHQASVAVLVSTVDDPARARELATIAVNALCTNDPAALVNLLANTPQP